MAVDNNVVLELGYDNLGKPAENHHVCPIHPEYAQLPPLVVDPAKAKAIAAAGLAETEFELISLDDDWQAATCDAVAAQIRDAGINIKRTVCRARPSGTTGRNIRSARPNGTCARWACRCWRWPTSRARPGTKAPLPTPSSTPSWPRRCRSRMPTSAAR
jgi:hypothetical protein